VREVNFEDQAHPDLKTDSCHEAFDLIVLATGVNTWQIAHPGLSYHPPKTAAMTQDELLPATDLRAVCEDKIIHVFGPGQVAGLLFGGLVPKGPYLNICFQNLF